MAESNKFIGTHTWYVDLDSNTWVGGTTYTVTFNEDGTCTRKVDEDEHDTMGCGSRDD